MKHRLGWAYPDADEFMRQEMKDDGTYQADHLRVALDFVTDWTLAVDAGSHVGLWTRPMSAKFAKVLAFEPSADTFAALTVNLAAFGCVNVEARNVALGAVAGWGSMTWNDKDRARANTGGRYLQTDGPIPIMALDAFELPSLGFLKLDVEGSEFAALQGARQTLQRCHPIVLFENKGLWTKFLVEPEAPQKLLTALGYRQLARAGCDLIWGAL